MSMKIPFVILALAIVSYGITAKHTSTGHAPGESLDLDHQGAFAGPRYWVPEPRRSRISKHRSRVKSRTLKTEQEQPRTRASWARGTWNTLTGPLIVALSCCWAVGLNKLSTLYQRVKGRFINDSTTGGELGTPGYQSELGRTPEHGFRGQVVAELAQEVNQAVDKSGPPASEWQIL